MPDDAGQLGLELFSLHDLRKTYITHASQFIPVDNVYKPVGYKEAEVQIQHYAGKLDPALVRDQERIGEYFMKLASGNKL